MDRIVGTIVDLMLLSCVLLAVIVVTPVLMAYVVVSWLRAQGTVVKLFPAIVVGVFALSALVGAAVAGSIVCIMILLGLVVAGLTVGFLILQDARQRRQAAPEEYERFRPQVTAWLPQCSEILGEEARKGRAYREGSPMFRARQKTLQLIEGAHGPAWLLYQQEFTVDTYRAVEELGRLKWCCQQCRVVNGGSSGKCLALVERRDVTAELRFRGEAVAQ